MRFAQANKARTGGIGKNLGILGRHTPFQQLRTRLGCDPGCIEQIFPTDRHPIQQAAPNAVVGAIMGGNGLVQGPLTGAASIDAVAVGVGFGRIQKRFGQRNRINLACTNSAPDVASAFPLPIHMLAPYCRSATLAALRPMDNPRSGPIVQAMAKIDADIVIVGGGLNGPCLALACAQAGFSSVVLDALPSDTRAEGNFDGRAYALALASVRMLGALGIWDQVAENAQPILEIKASDGRAGEGAAPFYLHFDHAEIEEGPMGHMLEDRYLRRALLDAMTTAPLVTHRPGAR